METLIRWHTVDSCLTYSGLVKNGVCQLFLKFAYWVTEFWIRWPAPYSMRYSAFIDNVIFKYNPISIEIWTLKMGKINVSLKSFPKMPKMLLQERPNSTSNLDWDHLICTCTSVNAGLIFVLVIYKCLVKVRKLQGPLLLTWFNFNPSMDK